MKKNFFILIIALLFQMIFYSCEREEVIVDNNPIIGTWIYESSEAGEIETNSEKNSVLIKPYVVKRGEYWFKGLKYEFKPYGYFESSRNGGSPLQATYTFSNGTLSATVIGGPTQSIKAKINYGLLIMEHNVTNDCNEIKLSDLNELGIEDINFKTIKAIVIIKFRKQ